MYDPYSIALRTRIRGKIEPTSIVGHIPREISRFCRYFIAYGGKIKASVRDTKFRRSPLPQGGLEVPITLRIEQGRTSVDIFQKMKSYVEGYYIEPDNIPITEEDMEVEEDPRESDFEDEGDESDSAIDEAEDKKNKEKVI